MIVPASRRIANIRKIGNGTQCYQPILQPYVVLSSNASVENKKGLPAVLKVDRDVAEAKRSALTLSLISLAKS